MNFTPAFTPCTKQKELKEAFSIFKKAARSGEKHLPDTIDTPCRSLEMIRTDVKDAKTPDFWIEDEPWMNTSVGLILDFTEFTYKEVRSVRGMDAQALIGKLY